MSDKEADTSVPVHELIAQRWSPRAFDAEAVLSSDHLRAMLEAARWAPSCGNTQPARFLVGLRGDETYKRILGSLTERNQAWAQRAGALLVGCVRVRNEKGDVPHAEFGVGLAVENLTLQAHTDGLAVHQMAGFDSDVVRQEFDLPAEFKPLVAIAVGSAAAPEVLEDEFDRTRETAPRERIALADLAFSGTWGESTFPS